jgi:hypothetical protein
MAFKIEVEGGSLRVTNLDNSVIVFEKRSDNTFFNSDALNDGRVSFYDTSGIAETQGIGFEELLSDCQNSAGTVFTDATLRTFVGANFKTASGSRGAKDNQIIVNQLNKNTTLGGVINSNKEYFLDGVIDLGTTQIDLSGGKNLNVKGYDFNTSGLISSEDNYTMVIGNDAGDILWSDFKIEVTGLNSEVLDVTDGTGFNAFEIARINFNNCTSRGTLNGYRQGLETGTGYFGGTPELTLDGTWIGGYFIDTSIVRGLTDGSYSLFKAGATFTMASRFRSNQNIDLNATVSFFDFAPANFINPSTLQLDNCLIARNGVFDASDSTIIPNISETNVESSFTNNVGISNTFVGGKLKVNSASATPIAAGSTYYTLNAAWTQQQFSHFDSPSVGQLRHLGVNPIEFRLQADFTVECTANNVLAIRLRVWRDKTSSFVEFQPQLRQVNSLVGGRDVAFFSIFTSLKLEKNDYVYFQIANNSGANNPTLELDSFYIIEER